MSTSAQTEVKLQSFTYAATMKLHSPEANIKILQDKFPGVNSLACESRVFSTYDECIGSCKKLFDDLLAKANGEAAIFKLGSEVNPVHSGQTTLSKDWAMGEISRLWIYDAKMEKTGQIHAVGQARIFGSVIAAAQVTLN